MPTAVTLFRLFVASPGDCRRERQTVREVAADWNVAYGCNRALHIEPVLWETHARPELGVPPQTAINRQLLDSCDAMVAIFRSRLGSPTAIAESGTVEEIERFRRMQKPVLLYFHRAQSSSEVERYRRLVGLEGLIWSYSGHWEFARDLAKHLALTMSTLAGTPKEEVTFAAEQVDQPADDGSNRAADRELVVAIRSSTSHLWRELEGLAKDHTDFTCAIRQSSFEKARSALDTLAARGHLSYKTEFAFNTDDDDVAVLYISVAGVSTPLRAAVAGVRAELGQKTQASQDSDSHSSPFPPAGDALTL